MPTLFCSNCGKPLEHTLSGLEVCKCRNIKSTKPFPYLEKSGKRASLYHRDNWVVWAGNPWPQVKRFYCGPDEDEANRIYDELEADPNGGG